MTGKLLFLIIISIFTWDCSNSKLDEPETQLYDTLQYASPEEAGMSAPKLKDAGYLFDNAVKENKVLGYQIVVARNGKVVLNRAGGIRDYEKNLPMERNTLINVASNTKTLVALSIMKLVDEGKLSIKDFVSDYIDGFELYPSNKITIAQLLLHQGGFMNFSIFSGEITQYSPEEPDAPSLMVEARKIGRRGLEEEPGTKYRYGNMGYNVLGAIVEKISGMKLGEYFKENFYIPLNMNETVHLLKDLDTARMAKQYYLSDGKWELMDVLFTPFVRGNGGTISTAWDFAKLFQMLVNKGTYNGKKILSDQAVVEATSPIIEVPEAYLSEEIEKSLGLPESEWFEYRDPRGLGIDKFRGYGFVVADNGGYSHAGIYGTFAYADPEEKLVIIIFAQSIYGGNPGQAFIEKIYESIID